MYIYITSLKTHEYKSSVCFFQIERESILLINNIHEKSMQKPI